MKARTLEPAPAAAAPGGEQWDRGERGVGGERKKFEAEVWGQGGRFRNKMDPGTPGVHVRFLCAGNGESNL